MPNPNALGPELGPYTNWGDYYARQSRIPWPSTPGPAGVGLSYPSSNIVPGSARAEREVVRQATIGAQTDLEILLKKEVRDRRKVKKRRLPQSKNPLLDYQKEVGKIAAPDLEKILAKDISRVPVQDVPSRKAVPKARPGAMSGRAAAKRVAGKVLSRAIPIYGQVATAADIAGVAVSVVEAVQNAYMERVLGQRVYQTAGRRRTGPQTRGKRGRKTQPKLSTMPVPGAVKVTGTQTATVRGIQSPQEMLGTVPDFAGQADKAAKTAEKAAKKAKADLERERKRQVKEAKKREREAKRAAARQRKIETRSRRAFERARAKRVKAEKRTSTRFGTRGSLQRWANELLGNTSVRGLIDQARGLTGSRSAGVASSGSPGQDKCQKRPDPCKSEAQRRAARTRKRRLGSKERICYSGTWRDTRKGRVTLTDKRIPCL